MIKNISVNEEGKYSITRKYEQDQIINILIQHFLKESPNVTVIDATAGWGGDTIGFCMSHNIHHVIAIEESENHFYYLRKNTQLLNSLYRSKLELIHDDCRNYFQNMIEDCNTKYVAYFDPPWGGPDYKSKDHIDLLLSGKQNIWEFIINSLPPFIKLVCIKIPKNCSYWGSQTSTHFDDHMFSIRNKYDEIAFRLVVLTLHSI